MSYLLDKREKRKKFLKVLLLVLLLFILIYFRVPIWRGLAYGVHTLFRPFLAAGGNVSGKVSNIGLLFQSKSSLEGENENLKLKLSETAARMSNYNSLLDENLKLKEILGRAGERKLVLSAILSKPNRSLYDTLIIDAGDGKGIKEGDLVTALGDVPIGRISDVYSDSSKVILFSNPGEKTEVLISGKDIFMQIVGRGGGNFEMILPRDLTLEGGTEVHLPGLMPQVLATVETVLSDPRDAFQKALLVSPVNIQELKFVEVEI